MTPKIVHKRKEKMMSKLDFIKIKNFVLRKTVKRMKRQAKAGENI